MSTIGSNPAGSGLADVMALRRQIVEQSDALRNLQGAGAAQPGGPDRASATPGDFAETLRGALTEVNASQVRASDLSSAYERGEVTDIAQVMLARQEAGVAFEATLQVRNKLLSAYQEIMRMGV